MRRRGWTIFLAIFSMLAAAAAHAEKRVALVIGNTAYQHTASLANPSASTGEAGTNRTGPMWCE